MMPVSFRSKVIILIVGIVWLVQTISVVTILTTTKNNIITQVENELEVGARVTAQILSSREKQLLSTVDTLAHDFGFREAAASQDEKTIKSALVNHASRVNADIASLLSLDGRVVASTLSHNSSDNQNVYQTLISEAKRLGYLSTTIVFEGEAYQAVIVPIHAPIRIAWVFIGFKIDNVLATHLKQLTGLDISFISSNMEGSSNLISTQPEGSHHRLKELVTNHQSLSNVITLNGDDYLTHKQIIKTPSDELDIILQRSLNDALLPYRTLRGKIILMTSVITLLAVLVAIMLARGVTRPINHLMLAAHRIKTGDYETSVETHSNDELGLLAQSFNTMQKSIAERESRIVYQANYDELTALPNRLLACNRITHAIQRYDRQQADFTLVIIEINNFEEINGSFGPKLSNHVLIESTRRLKSMTRESDTVARVGVKQFLVMLENTNYITSVQVTENIASILKNVIVIDTAQISLRINIGVVVFPDHGDEMDILFQRLSIALQDSKKQQNEITCYQSGRDEDQLRQLTIIRDIPLAGEAGQFKLYYQPKLQAVSGEVREVEALIRWIHPELGFLPPDEFIQIAEQSGTIKSITRWVLDTALEQCKAWKDDGIHLRVCINLSALDLLDINLPKYIQHTLDKNHLTPQSVLLEITESAVMRDLKTSQTVLQNLRAAGLHLAIDDFGTGYSSLSQLKQLPIHELKIDKSFVLNLTRQSDDAVIVRSTIELAHNMGLSVTAEGVETEEGQKLLEEYGCDVLQGYFFSRPLPSEEFELWLELHRQSLDEIIPTESQQLSNL